MKLRLRLLLLVGSACLLFLGSLGAYTVLMGQLDEMERETAVFQEVDRATAEVQVQINALAVEPFEIQVPVVDAALERYNAALAAVEGVKVLIRVSPEMAQAVTAVSQLGALSAGGITDVKTSLTEVVEFIPKTSLSASSASFFLMGRVAYSPDYEESALLQFALSSLSTRISTLNQSLTVTRKVVQTKDSQIQQGVQAVKLQSTQVGVFFVMASLLVAMVISFFVARNLAQAMAHIGATVAKVGAGDLRPRFQTRRKDELGHLGQDINTLLDSLTTAFRRIQAASAENLQVKDLLVQSVSAATASAVEIEANSASILAQLQKVDERIQASEADLNGVVILLEAFHGRLGTQGRDVADAGKAVTELAQGIAQVGNLSGQNRLAVEALLAESDRGREVFDRSFAKVAEINDSVADIQDLVGAIADIAGQTNILALNAAIEAAHAGEAGKGFAVVADEISKLAAASAASSAQIALTIKDVVGKIREAGATREETLGAFDAIGTQIAKVSSQGRGIYEEADRMNRGTDRIREVMESLAASAEDTTREADRIGTVATKLGDALGQVGRISHEVVSNIGEISTGLGEISRTVTEVSAQADRLGRVGLALDQAVNAFQTEEETQS